MGAENDGSGVVYYGSGKPGEQSGVAEIDSRLLAMLEDHFTDLAPESTGRGDLLKEVSGDHLAAVNCRIDRSDPPLELTCIRLTPGAMTIVVGGNGSGKSTLFDALMGIKEAHINSNNGEGAILVGEPPNGRPAIRVSRLFQEETLKQIGDMTAVEVVGQTKTYFLKEFPDLWDLYGQKPDDDALYNKALTNDAARQRIEELSSKATRELGMTDFLDSGRKVNELSGGERTKLSILIMLLSQPDVVLADEPTNHLDLSTTAKLIGVLGQYTRDNAAVACVSHVEWFKVAVGRDGVTLVKFDNRTRKAVYHGSSYGNYRKSGETAGHKTITENEEQPLSWSQPDYRRKAGQNIFSDEDITTIPDSPLVNVSVPSLVGGELVVISGDNGTGKSKLLQHWLTNKVPDVNCAYLPQFLPAESSAWTVGDYFDWIKSQASPHSTGSAQNIDLDPKVAFARKLKDLHFGSYRARSDQQWLNQKLSQLSNGESRLMWFIAATVLRDVDALFLDEPTNHMDQEMTSIITRLILEFKGAVILTSHDIDLMEAITDQDKTPTNKRLINHFVLTKNAGRSAVNKSNQSPKDYASNIVEQSKKRGGRIVAGN